MSNICTALEAVRQRLNEFLQAAQPRTEEWAVLSNLVDPEGKAYVGARNRLVMFLSNVQKETVISTSSGVVPAGDTHYAMVAPPLHVNLYVLVFANFYDASYTEGLATLSLALGFFQQNPSFTPATLPALPPGVERLDWDMVSLAPADLSYLVGLAGVRYLPSAVYRVRLLTFRSDAARNHAPAVQGVQTPGRVAAQAVRAEGAE